MVQLRPALLWADTNYWENLNLELYGFVKNKAKVESVQLGKTFKKDIGSKQKSKKFCVGKIWVKEISGGKKNLGQKKILGTVNILCPKHILVPEKFKVNKKFWV